MRKSALLAMLGALALVGSAQAKKPHPSPTPPHPVAPHTTSPQPAAPRCTTHFAGYRARGTLVSSALTASGRNRYTGTLEVNVTRANHRAPTGDQTFTLTNARVKFHHGVTPPGTAGDRVTLHGKITQQPKRCGSFTPTITVTKADIRRPAKH